MSPRTVFLFLVTSAAVILVGLIAAPFLPAITGAVGLAVITYRPHEWIRRTVKNRSLSAALTLIMVILLLILPAIFVISGVAGQLSQALQYFQTGQFQDTTTELLARHPALESLWKRVVQEFDLGDAVKRTSAFLASNVGGFLGGSLATLTQIVLMLFTLFFLYRDREACMDLLRSLLPIEDRQKDVLLERIRDAIYATLQGSLSIALIQGSLGGVMFWILGIPAALVWGVFMSLMALIPSLGTFLVWMPAAVYLFLSGYHWKALILFAWGSLVISTIDNILYPTLVGSRLRLHTVAVLFSVLGAVALVGIPGIVLGPLILTTTLTLISFWQERAVASASTSESDRVRA
jgi:predicted PurR-regulated permease PerM